MWNPFKKSKPVSLPPGTRLKSAGGNRVTIDDSNFSSEMCIAHDPDVPTTVGYLDDEKNFHSTKDAALKSNIQLEKQRIRLAKEQKIADFKEQLKATLRKYLTDTEYDDIYYYGRFGNAPLIDAIARHPKPLLEVLEKYVKEN